MQLKQTALPAVLAVSLTALAAWLTPAYGAEPPKVLWEKSFGEGQTSSAYALTATENGDLVVAGGTVNTSTDSYGFWVARLDGDGNTLWRQDFPSFEFNGRPIIATLPGDRIVVAGLSDIGRWSEGEVDISALYLDSDGTEQRTWTFRGRDWSLWPQLAIFPDGGIAVAGSTVFWRPGYPHKLGLDQVWRARVVRIDAYANLVWNRQFGMGHEETAHAVTALPDGGLVVAGQTSGVLGPEQIWMLRLDPHGNDYYRNVFPENDDDVLPRLIDVWPDGDVALAIENWQATRVIRQGLRSLPYWDRLHGEGNIVPDAIAALPDGGVAVAGNILFERDLLDEVKLVRLGPDGSIMWAETFESKKGTIDGIAVLPDGGLAVAGDWLTSPEDDKSREAWVLRLAPE